jgi:hypothetical protein
LGGREADLLGEAVGVLGAECEVNEIPLNPRGFQGKLRDEAILVLEFRSEVLLAEDRRGTVDDVREFFGGKAMVGIVCHPGLQAEVGKPADGCSAVEEGLVDASHLGDMGVDGNQTTVGQDELEMMTGVGPEDGEEFGGFHVEWERVIGVERMIGR